MPLYIVTLGSNTPDKEERVADAIEWLASILTVEAKTRVYSSPDAYHTGRPPYANAIVIGESATDASHLDQLFKEYEMKQGRDRQTTAVPIDIDIVACDSLILRPRDYTAPYFLKGLSYLSSCLK